MKKVLSCIILAIEIIAVFGCGKNVYYAEVQYANETIKEIVEEEILPKDNKINNTLNNELKYAEEKYNELIEKMNIATTQLEMNKIAENMYNLWDEKLNIIWKKIELKNDEASQKMLLINEENWKKQKDELMRQAGEKYEGGSIRPLIEFTKGAYEIQKRTYELAKYLAALTGEDVEVPSLPRIIEREESAIECNETGDFYNQWVSGNIVDGIQWKYKIKNGNMEKEDDLVNFYDIKSKTEVGDFFYFFRGVNAGDETIEWTLYDTATGIKYYSIILDFVVDSENSDNGYKNITLVKKTVKDNRPTEILEYDFYDEEIVYKEAGN